MNRAQEAQAQVAELRKRARQDKSELERKARDAEAARLRAEAAAVGYMTDATRAVANEEARANAARVEFEASATERDAARDRSQFFVRYSA